MFFFHFMKMSVVISAAFAAAKCMLGLIKGCGFVKVICGFLLLCDSQRILLSRLLTAPDGGLPEPPFYYIALGLLGAGLTICFISTLGIWATYMPGYILLTIYFLVVLGLLVCECAGGVIAAVWPRCEGLQSARGGAVGALQAYYAVPDYEEFTAAVDLAQTHLRCCGMSDARNYDMSVWQLRRLGPRGLSVPLSCCIQTEDVSYLNPVPLNQSRCQDIQPNPTYRHAPGCLEKIEEWYQRQYLIFVLALFVTAIFKLGILLSTVFSCIRLRRRRQYVRSFMMKSKDNKTNENIYERKMGMHDSPITTKYIQPNNYYSPRVRNPKMFHGKSNEII